jgi:hypothetical protein
LLRLIPQLGVPQVTAAAAAHSAHARRGQW